MNFIWELAQIPGVFCSTANAAQLTSRPTVEPIVMAALFYSFIFVGERDVPLGRLGRAAPAPTSTKHNQGALPSFVKNIWREAQWDIQYEVDLLREG